MIYFENEKYYPKNISALTWSEEEFCNCEFHNLDLHGLMFKNCKFFECQFHQCNLSNLSVNYSTFRDIFFFQTKAVGVNWTFAKSISDVKFDQSILDYSVFLGLDLKASVFTKSSLKKVDFSACNLKGSDYRESDLLESSFNNSNLEISDFRDAKNYWIDISCTKLAKAKFSFPDAIALLKVLNIQVEGF
ncbi:MAG: pentapeptide repeat-containing protein [Bdellovibrio sp.]|nr:pentapeptide repeat-containing protein [Bdellovibrio sp.]